MAKGLPDWLNVDRLQVTKSAANASDSKEALDRIVKRNAEEVAKLRSDPTFDEAAYNSMQDEVFYNRFSPHNAIRSFDSNYSKLDPEAVITYRGLREGGMDHDSALLLTDDILGKNTGLADGITSILNDGNLIEFTRPLTGNLLGGDPHNMLGKFDEGDVAGNYNTYARDLDNNSYISQNYKPTNLYSQTFDEISKDKFYNSDIYENGVLDEAQREAEGVMASDFELASRSGAFDDEDVWYSLGDYMEENDDAYRSYLNQEISGIEGDEEYMQGLIEDYADSSIIDNLRLARNKQYEKFASELGYGSDKNQNRNYILKMVLEMLLNGGK